MGSGSQALPPVSSERSGFRDATRMGRCRGRPVKGGDKVRHCGGVGLGACRILQGYALPEPSGEWTGPGHADGGPGESLQIPGEGAETPFRVGRMLGGCLGWDDPVSGRDEGLFGKAPVRTHGGMCIKTLVCTRTPTCMRIARCMNLYHCFPARRSGGIRRHLRAGIQVEYRLDAQFIPRVNRHANVVAQGLSITTTVGMIG